ncbi:hypothetical protein GJ496_002803 [Pomphorhynchus laevis]|nr:hypothetical protein GJ496_002803 [Pomphorhynchus laevis]
MLTCDQTKICIRKLDVINLVSWDYVQPNPKGEPSLDLGTKHQDRINSIDLSTLNARIQNTPNDTSIRTNDKVTETEAGLRQQFMNEHSMDKSTTEVSTEFASLEQIYCECTKSNLFINELPIICENAASHTISFMFGIVISQLILQRMNKSPVKKLNAILSKRINI